MVTKYEPWVKVTVNSFFCCYPFFFSCPHKHNCQLLIIEFFVRSKHGDSWRMWSYNCPLGLKSEIKLFQVNTALCLYIYEYSEEKPMKELTALIALSVSSAIQMLSKWANLNLSKFLTKWPRSIWEVVLTCPLGDRYWHDFQWTRFMRN